MQFFSNLLRNKSEEEKSSNSISMLNKELNDSAKPVRKRFSNLVSALKKRENNPIERGEIIHSQHETAVHLCKSMLKDENIKNNKKGAAWEDVSTVMKVLFDITRYGYDLHLEDLKAISSIALNDTNRWEMKELGLNLLLNILNMRPEDELALRLLESVIDLNLFKEEVQDYNNFTFPDRSLLTQFPVYECFWNLPAQDSLKKLYPYENSLEISSIKQFSAIPFTNKQKECLKWIDKLLNYTLETDLSKANISQKDRFNIWLSILKNSFLYLIYPNISKPLARLGDVTGFTEQCPAIIHYLVIRWLIKCIKNASLRDCLFNNDENYDFWMNVLSLSFTPCATFSAIWPESARKCLELYNEWVVGRYQIIGRSFSSHVSGFLGHTVQLFDYSKEFSRRNELCKFVIEILKNFSKDCKDIGVLIESSLTISKVLKQTSRDQSPETYRPMVEFLLYTMLEVYSKYPLPWQEFKSIFRRWSRTSDTIVEHWSHIMLTLTHDFKVNNYQSDSLGNAWQNIMHILGNPLKFYSMVLNSWTKGLKDIIYILIKPSQQAPSTNFMLKNFAKTLIRLITNSKELETRKIAYKNLLKIFINTRGNEKPHEFYILHLARLIQKSLEENNALTDITIACLPKLLPYFPELHILLPNALSAAVSKNHEGVKLAITVMALPNYYKNSKIYGMSLSGSFTYEDMHKYISAILENSVNIITSAPKALWGISVSIVEKLSYSLESAENLLANCILKALSSKRDEIVLVSLQCLNFLSCYLEKYTDQIMTILIKCLDSAISNLRNNIISEFLQTILNWLLINNSKPCSPEILSKFFQSLQCMSITLQENSFICSTIEILCSTFAFYYLNFPLRNEMSSVSQSNISDSDIYSNRKVSHFSLGESAVISVINSPEASKFIVRTPIGKFYWESENYNVIEAKSLHPVEVSREMLKLDTEDELIITKPPDLLKDEPLIPLLMQYIRDSYTDRPPRLFEPDPKISNEILSFCNIEKEFTGKLHDYKSSSTLLSQTRSMLSHMNLLEISGGNFGNLKLLESGDRLDRSLKLLDGTISRERIKIGVIYVAAGQKDQREILENQNASLLFQEFIKKLGTVVDVVNYEGYIGGLEPGGSSGKQTVAYCDWGHEVAFHIIPLMPTDPNDEQQVLKKRHVGNDIVQIVWSENSRDYLQDTITSQFNIVHIIIYPLPYNLFRIQILKKISGPIGPLQDGMIIPWTTMPNLVRVTALNANQLYRSTQQHKYEKPMFIRKKLISDIIGRHEVDNKLHVTLSDLF